MERLAHARPRRRKFEWIASNPTSAFAGFLGKLRNGAFQGCMAQFALKRAFARLAAAMPFPALGIGEVEGDIGFHARALEPR
jgi:predicted lipid-binding transport protein (Tim44 family)